MLFGHLLFKSLSRDVVNDALLLSKLDAERIARGVAERSAGDPYLVKLKQTEIDRYVRQGLSERQILTEVQIERRPDARGRLLVRRHDDGARERAARRRRGARSSPSSRSFRSPRTYVGERPAANPYDIEIPIGEFAVLRFGVSRKELAKRVEKLRNELYLRTFAAAGRLAARHRRGVGGRRRSSTGGRGASRRRAWRPSGAPSWARSRRASRTRSGTR